MKKLYQLIKKNVPKKVNSININYPSYPQVEPQRRCPDISKLNRTWFKNRVSINDSIRRFYNWSKHIINLIYLLNSLKINRFYLIQFYYLYFKTYIFNFIYFF